MSSTVFFSPNEDFNILGDCDGDDQSPNDAFGSEKFSNTILNEGFGGNSRSNSQVFASDIGGNAVENDESTIKFSRKIATEEHLDHALADEEDYSYSSTLFKKV